MSESVAMGYVAYPAPEPTCCPDAYLCDGEIECARHGGFDVCCSHPEKHVPQDREAWHRMMDLWEQGLLNKHIQRHKIFQAYGLQDSPMAARDLSALI
ncbi:hypothetical protein ACH4S8_37505 [Streptomyces sp. NPDC021080]|uniref:hypothetical protein n=1 Tax=Streptomyces sp. NPDC021080 TaxID=3365110 RepID=UPI0037A8649C